MEGFDLWSTTSSNSKCGTQDRHRVVLFLQALHHPNARKMQFYRFFLLSSFFAPSSSCTFTKSYVYVKDFCLVSQCVVPLARDSKVSFAIPPNQKLREFSIFFCCIISIQRNTSRLNFVILIQRHVLSHNASYLVSHLSL